MFSTKYGLCGPIKSTGEVPQRTSSHLATIVSRALQPQDGKIPCPVDRNLEIFFTSHIDFLFARALDAWRCMWICVRCKDAQKQLARTSLGPGQTETQVEDLGQLVTSFGQGLRALASTCDDLSSFRSRSNLRASRRKFFTVRPPNPSQRKLSNVH